VNKFSNYLTLLLLTFVGVPLIIVVVSFYTILGNSIKQQHFNKVKTKQVEISKDLIFRMNEVESVTHMMSELNSIRVNLLLGMNRNVKEAIQKTFPSNDSTYFFVMEPKDFTFLPKLPEFYLGLKSVLMPHSHSKEKHLELYLYNGQILSIFATPISKEDGKLLGTAIGIYNISKDDGFWHKFGPQDHLIINYENSYIDLRTNALYAEHNFKAISNSPESIVIPLTEFSGLFYKASTKPVSKVKRFWLYVLLAHCVIIFGFTFGVAFFIARKVAGPLADIGQQAASIADDPTDVVLKKDEIKYSEFQTLIDAFNDLLTNLLEAREKLLEQSEDRYRALALSSLSGVWHISKDGETIFINPAMCEMLEIKDPDEIKGKTFHSFFTPDSLEVMDKEHYKRSDGVSSSYEVEIVGKRGGSRNVIVSGAPLFSTDGELESLIGTFVDITELKKLQVKFSRAQKMEALGLLAGGVAHDLNNILSGIVSYPELILMDLPQDSKLRKPIKTIEASGKKAAAVVNDLITIARGVASAKEVHNINAIINTFLTSPEYNKLVKYHPDVSITENLSDDLLNVFGSPVHLEKIIMNLVSNAAEAIEGLGQINISTENQHLEKPIRGYDDVKVGDYVVLRISDSGPGISDEDLNRIFEPFYSKKVMGRSGTGLGLAVVWNTIRDHDGYIDVKSSEKGTTFTLYIPVTRKELPAFEMATSLDDIKGSKEKILVIDDVPEQREVACTLLEKLNYKAESVSSGENAIEYLKRNAVDLLILDMIMAPGINGRETYARIIEIHPGQKAIIASGFAETYDVKETQRLGAGQYVKKPYTLEKIGLAVRDELTK